MESGYDVAILGSGPAGTAAAFEAAERGLRAILIERTELGGTCLHRGCIPSKALIASSELFRAVQSASEMGIEIQGATLNFQKAVERKDAIVRGLASQLERALTQSKVEILHGNGILETPESPFDARTPPFRVRVTQPDGEARNVHALHVVIATGSEPATPLDCEVDGERIVTSTEALNWREIPKSLLIVGGGTIACEFAGMLAPLSAVVTIVEALPNILSTEDISVSRQMATLLKRDGVTIHTNARVSRFDKSGDAITAHLTNGQTVSAEKVLVCVGRRRNSEGLSEQGFNVELGKVVVDERMETSIPGIYAIGDVAGDVLLAHWGSAQGQVAVRNICGEAAVFDGFWVPGCIYTHPEIGRVGFTESQARDAGKDVVIERIPFAGNGRALCSGEAQGFVKIVADNASRSIMGVHILAAHATELIHECAVALKAGIRLDDFAEVVHGHPTLAETIGETVRRLRRGWNGV